MTEKSSLPGPGWLEVILDGVIALLLPKVGVLVIGLVIPSGPALATAGLVLVLLAFCMIGKVRGREGLVRHLIRVVGLLSALTFALSRDTAGVTLLSLLVLASAAALGGWVGSRRA